MRAAARLLCLACLLLMQPVPAAAAPRGKSVSPPRQTLRLLPAAEAPEALAAPLLSGLDYSAVAPPGVLLRVIEDEPYIYAQGDSARAARHFDQGFSVIRLVSLLPDGGRYEARVLLREARGDYAAQALESFDQTAHSAYARAGLTLEQRELDAYYLREVRSPLGLLPAATGDRAGLPQREYLDYAAEIVNPLSPEDFANLSTPYSKVAGQLQVAWETRGRDAGAMLLSIEFSASAFPHSLTLSENIARCVVNRARERQNQRERLSYLAYHPEFELPALNRLWYGQQLDWRTADLAERPSEGVGIDPQAIQGDLCPDFLGSGPAWPAQPYRDRDYLQRLSPAGQPLPICSHCLLSGALPEAQRRMLEQRERERLRTEQQRERGSGTGEGRQASDWPEPDRESPPDSGADEVEFADEADDADDTDCSSAACCHQCGRQLGRVLQTAAPSSVCRE